MYTFYYLIILERVLNWKASVTTLHNTSFGTIDVAFYETSYLLMNLLEDGVSSDLSLGGLPGFLLGSPVFIYGGGLHKSSAAGRLGGRPLPLPLTLAGVPVLRRLLQVAVV